MATVCFLLPGKLYRPVGGHKIVYQHANYMARNGFDVIIANNTYAPAGKNPIFEALRMLHAALRILLRSLQKKNSCRGWFSLEATVREKQVWDFRFRHMPKADRYIATDATTSPFLETYPIPWQDKFYFIQGYENWCMTEEQLHQTYHYSCNILVISRWLERIMEREGVKCRLVPNGYDASEFFLTVPVEKKDRFHISMLYHLDSIKNVRLGLEALAIVHEQVPNIRVSLFGVYEAPDGLPPYISYTHNPDHATHNDLNNSAAIFIGTSDREGWGLTVLEAMACGQAVACTDNDGYREMAVDNINALISPVGDAKAMADNIVSLVFDNAKRIRLANKGLDTASAFTIEQSNRLFVDCLSQRG